MSAETKTPAPSTTTLFDLVSDFNRLNLKSMLWLQERALELSKILVRRAESFQVESRSIVEEYMAEARRAGQVSQRYFRQGLQNTVETAREYETTASEEITDVLNHTKDQLDMDAKKVKAHKN